MLTIIKFIAQFGIRAALKKYGKAAIMQVAKNHGLVKNVKKVIPKAKGLTAKQMAKRELAIEKKKAAIALKKFQDANITTVTRGARGKIKPKTVKPINKPKGKPSGYVIQNFRGKPKPYYKKD